MQEKGSAGGSPPADGGAEGAVAGEDERSSDDGVVLITRTSTEQAGLPQFAGQSEEEYQVWRQSVVPARRRDGSGHKIHRRSLQQEEPGAQNEAEDDVPGGHGAGKTAAISSGWGGQDSAEGDGEALAALRSMDQETLSTLYGVRSSGGADLTRAGRREEAALIDAKLAAVRRLDDSRRKVEAHSLGQPGGADAPVRVDCLRASRRSGLEVHQPEAWHMRLYPHDHVIVLAIRGLVLLFCALDVSFVFAEATSYTGCAECVAAGGPYGAGAMGLRGHLPRGFWDAKVVLGLLADAGNVLYMASSCRVYSTTLRDLPPQERRWAVAKGYLKGRFTIDLICMVPIYWVFIENPWVRANRFLLFIRAMAQASTFEAAPRTLGVPGRLMHFCVALPVVLHVVACCCIMLAWRSMEMDGGVAHTLRWLCLEREELLDDWPFMYLHAHVWSLSTMTGLGGCWAPQTAVQAGWTWAVIVSGVLMCVWLLRLLIAGGPGPNQAAAEFAMQRDMSLAFLKARGVPRGGQQRVQGYFDALSKGGLRLESRAVLDGLPPFIRCDVSSLVLEQFLSRFPVFFGVGREALSRMSACLVHTVAAKGASILRTGDRVEHVIFVMSGLLRASDGEGRVLMDLFEGSLVGDIPALMGIPSPHNVVAAADCELAVMSIQDLNCIQEAFPAVKQRLLHRGQVVYQDKWVPWMDETSSADDTQRERGGDPGKLASMDQKRGLATVSSFTGFPRMGSVSDSFAGGEVLREMHQSQQALAKTVNQIADAQVKILQHLTSLQAPEAIEALRQRVPTEPKSERKHKHHHRHHHRRREGSDKKSEGAVPAPASPADSYGNVGPSSRSPALSRSVSSQSVSPTVSVSKLKFLAPNAGINEKPALRPLPDLPGVVPSSSQAGSEGDPTLGAKS